MNKIDFSKWSEINSPNNKTKRITATVEFVQDDNSRAVVRSLDGTSVKLLNKTGELLSVGDTVQVVYNKLLSSKTAYIDIRNGKPNIPKSDDKGVGENTEGKTFKYNGNSYEGNKTAEIFNDYTNNISVEAYSHAEGNNTKALGTSTHTEGCSTIATGTYSHAEGYQTSAHGYAAHTEGEGTIVTDGSGAHAEGYYSVAYGQGAHAEGSETNADASNAHAEGSKTFAGGYASHAEGEGTKAYGRLSHSEGYNTYAAFNYQHVMGKYNVYNNNQAMNHAFIIGNGTSENNRSNAFAIDWNGNIYIGNNTTPINLIDIINRLEALENKV